MNNSIATNPLFRHHHLLIDGESQRAFKLALDVALTVHSPEYAVDPSKRTRISLIVSSADDARHFVFLHKELFDNSWWRVVTLSSDPPCVETHRPQYHGQRPDFVDVEWEFVVGRISNPRLLQKAARWDADPARIFSVLLCYAERAENEAVAAAIRKHLPAGSTVEIFNEDNDAESARREELMQMAKYLNYFYEASFRLRYVPTQLPVDEVDDAWQKLDDRMKMSNYYSVMAIPFRMSLLGHKSDDWDSYYALTADEIEALTPAEHNRWCVERLIQGSRPCTDAERAEIAGDMHLRLSDPDYAAANPVSLKKKYKLERNAHYDLCAFSELDVDESGLSVVRYDRDLIAATPLIVKAFNDERHG